MLIGEIEGTVTTSNFKFKAYKDIKKFDFVAVKSNERWILSQVDSVIKYPDGKTTGNAKIIGYREKNLLRKPRHVIKPNSLVYLADQELISETLGLLSDGLYIGRLETNEDISIFIDSESIYKHLAILAKTGAGKSYLTAVIIEELLEKNFPVIVIDPHGEYYSLREENEISEGVRNRYAVLPKGYPIKEYALDTRLNPEALPLTFSSANIDAKTITTLLPTSLTNSQLGVLFTAIKDLQGKEKKGYNLTDVINQCMTSQSKAKWTLLNMLELLRDTGLFSDEGAGLDPVTLIKHGQATIINLKGVKQEIQQMVVHKLAEDLFTMRKAGEIDPFIMVMEEAHNFVPERSFGKAICSDILRNISSEGRKFGLGLVIVSQRPANISKNVLSQCNTQVIMRVTNPNDLNAISKSFENVTPEIRDYITGLPPGVGLLLGKEYPIITDIRTRRSRHGGGTKKVSEKARETRIKIFSPLINKEALEKRYSSKFRTAYYPLWLLGSKSKKLILDAKTGDIKARTPEIGTEESNILKIIKISPRTRGELIEKTKKEFSEISALLEVLIDKKLVKKQGDKYVAAGKDLFDLEKRYILSLDDKVISSDIDENKAIAIGTKELGEKVTSIELIYYPYYTLGEIVFDAVRGKEI